MTTNISRADTFRGFPAKTLREVLKCWQFGMREPDDIGERPKVSLNGAAVLALIQDSHDLGLIGMVTDPELDMFPQLANMNQPELGLTTAGLAVANASATRRMEKAKARALFDGLLEKAAKMNADPKAPIKVDRIWLFGSMVDESKSEVGDIDFVIEHSPSEFGKNLKFKELYEHVLTNYPDMLPESFDPYYGSVSGAFLARSLYGKRRHHMFSPNDIYTLVGLHRPCQLAFDHSRGGKVDDAVLPHHPKSEKRSEHINPRLKMPDLSAVPEEFLPTSAEWIADDYKHDYHGPKGMTIHYSDDDTTEATGVEGLDGRISFVISFEGEGREGSVAILVERTLTSSEGFDRYDCRVDVVLDTSEQPLSRNDVEYVGKILDKLVGADMVRLAGRRHDLAQMKQIDIHMHAPNRAEYAYAGRYPGLNHRVMQVGDNIILNKSAPEMTPAPCRFNIESYAGEDDFSSGYVTLDTMEDEDWETFGQYFPFTREECEDALRLQRASNQLV